MKDWKLAQADRESGPGRLQVQWAILSGSDSGFLNESAMHTWLEDFAKLFVPEVAAAGAAEADSGKQTAKQSVRYVTFEQFHEAVRRVGFGLPRSLSRTLWCLAFSPTAVNPSSDAEVLFTDIDKDVSKLRVADAGVQWEIKCHDSDTAETNAVETIQIDHARTAEGNEAYSVTGPYGRCVIMDPADIGAQVSLLRSISQLCEGRVKLTGDALEDLQPVPPQLVQVREVVDLAARNRGGSTAFGREYCTESGFHSFLRRLGIDVPDRNVRAIWSDLIKSNFVFSKRVPTAAFKKLPKEERRSVKIEDDKYFTTVVRESTIGRDPLDETKGNLIRFSGVGGLVDQLPRVLSRGLWDAVVQLLIRDTLQMSISESELRNAVLELGLNRYGLFKPDLTPALLQRLACGGATFSMMQMLISRMGLQVSDQVLRRAYNMLDVNQDNSLNESEFLGGFRLLFRELIPQVVLMKTGLTIEQIVPILVHVVCILILVFCFLTFAFQSFVGTGDSVSSAMQSMLAAGAAFGAKMSAARDKEKARQQGVSMVQEMMNMSKEDEANASTSKGQGESSQGGGGAAAVQDAPVPIVRSFKYSGLPKVAKGSKDVQLVAEPKSETSGEQPKYTLHPRLGGKGGVEIDAARLRFSIVPALPRGLKLTRDGEITGTPLRGAPLQTYVVSCKGGQKTVTTRLSFSVRPSADAPALIYFKDVYTGLRCRETPVCLSGHVMEDAEQPTICDGCSKDLKSAEERKYVTCRDCCYDLCQQCASVRKSTSFGLLVPYDPNTTFVAAVAEVFGYDEDTTKEPLSVGNLRFKLSTLPSRRRAAAGKKGATADEVLMVDATGKLSGKVLPELLKGGGALKGKRQLVVRVKHKKGAGSARVPVKFVARPAGAIPADPIDEGIPTRPHSSGGQASPGRPSNNNASVPGRGSPPPAPGRGSPSGAGAPAGGARFGIPWGR